MRPIVPAVLVLVWIALTAPAAAQVVATRADSAAHFTLGSSLGMDVIAQHGESLVLVASSPNVPFLLPLPDPGLRLGLVLPDRRTEFAVNLSLSSANVSGGSLTALGVSLEGNRMLTNRAGDNPYVGLHAGVAQVGAEGDAEGASEVGAQLGVLNEVAGGHGAVRLELRAGLVTTPQREAMTRYGLRLGYDLWLP